MPSSGDAEFATQAAPAALEVDYVTRERLESEPESWWRQVLGVVGFARPPGPTRTPSATTMTPLLGGVEERCEVWRVGGAECRESLISARRGGVHYRFGENLLFGSLHIEDTVAAESGAAVPGAAALFDAAQAAYEDLFAVLDATQYRHLIRVWNYVPEINATVAGEERYRLFNSARRTAFLESGRAVIGSSVPAACALGVPAGAPMCVYFLAARRPTKTIENPRQTSAYYYPPKFGKHSPIFSRACIFGDAQHGHLFISGTASIVGCETLHAGDVQAQTCETLANINALLDEANRICGSKRYAMDSLKFKVYVRHAADLERIQAVLTKEVPGCTPLYLHADICRQDLVVEIEATGQAR